MNEPLKPRVTFDDASPQEPLPQLRAGLAFDEQSGTPFSPLVVKKKCRKKGQRKRRSARRCGRSAACGGVCLWRE